jgi:hypothetical protein
MQSVTRGAGDKQAKGTGGSELPGQLRQFFP